MKVLVTGLTGFVGSHLADYILATHPDVEIWGLVRWRSPMDNIAHIKDRLRFVEGDLRDLSSLLDAMREAEPDRIFHLAAQSFVPYSFTAPAETMATNALGTINLLEAVMRTPDSDPLIHVCSSSEVYGQVEEHETPICEDNPLRPASPYAVSKVAADMAAMQYGLSYGLKIVRTRAFTHTGRRRGDVFAESAFAKQIVACERGKASVVKVGNLDSIRTIMDVRDCVRAYWLALEHGEPGAVYNVGGRETMTVGEVLSKLINLSTMPNDIGFTRDEALIRPSDVTRQIPDWSLFRDATGWEPEIPVKETLEDLLDWHRGRP